MNCEHAQALLFDSLAQQIPQARRLELDAHIASCEDCRELADAHRELDARLTAAVPQVELSPHFRTRLRARLRREVEWPDYWPDLAHLSGCAVAVCVLLVVLPDYRERVALLGAGFTIVSHFVQSLLRGADT